MALYVRDRWGDIYGRIYYLVTYEDGTELVFMTTNESEFEIVEPIINDDFTLINSISELISGFDSTEIIGKYTESKTSFTPNYIFYDIITIDKSIKPLILEHLMESISEYTSLDFSELEEKRIKKWLDYLKEN